MNVIEEAADNNEAAMADALRKINESHQRAVTRIRNIPSSSPSFELVPRLIHFADSVFELARSAAAHVHDATGQKLVDEWQKSGPHTKKESAYMVEQFKILSSKIQELSGLAKRGSAIFQDLQGRFKETVEQDAGLQSSSRNQIFADAEIAIERLRVNADALVSELDVERSNLREFFERRERESGFRKPKSKWKFRD